MAYASTTRATLRARLQDRIDGVAWWSATEANDAINEALRQFNLFTGYWRGSVSVNTSANDPFLAVGATLTKATRVTRAGQVLTRKSIVEFYRMRRHWRSQTIASGGAVPTSIREWAPIGVSTIAIWPAHTGVFALTIEAVKITPILIADGDFVDLGDEEIDALLDEALWILGFKRPSALDGLEVRHQHFLAACLDKNDQLRGSSYFRKLLGLEQEYAIKRTKVPQDEDAEAPA